MSEGTQRKLAAILAADIVGYSSLMGEDESGTLSALRTMRSDLFEPAIGNHRGAIVKSMGDGWLVEFDSAVDAVTCAIEVQEKLSGHKILELRIGLHIGEITHADDDIFGDGVNIAARLQEIAEPGAIVISDMARRSVDGKLAGMFVDLGAQNLKNISEPVPAYGWGMTAVAADDTALASPDKPSIAVLPFENMSGDPEQEYFADGLTEDLITALSQWRTFPVIARNSTFIYKNASVDIRRAARELGAHYIVEGSVRKSGNRIRVAVQLIEGPTGHHLWAENLDRDLHDMFELQDDLTQRIAGTVMPELEQKDVSTRASRSDKNLDAWGLLHQALMLICEFHPEGYAEARALLERAIEIDPRYARAYAWLAYSYNHDVVAGATKSSLEHWKMAAAVARRSIELDELDGFAHFVLGLIYFRMGQHDLALSEQLRATELNPSLAMAQLQLGQVLAQSGRTEEGIPILEKGLLLNPRDPRNWNALDVTTNACITAGNYERAVELARNSIQRRPDNAMSHLYLAVALGQLDRIDEAQSELATARGIDPDIVQRHESIRPQKFPEDRVNFVEGFRKAALPE